MGSMDMIIVGICMMDLAPNLNEARGTVSIRSVVALRLMNVQIHNRGTFFPSARLRYDVDL